MCVTLGEARLSQTTLFVNQVPAPGGGHLHVCGYQNRVQNLMSGLHTRSGRYPNSSKGTGNAMILPFPALPGTMSQKNFLTGMDACSHVLEDMVAAISPPEEKSFSSSLGVDRSLDVEIFELDIYTVVLAQHARLIPDAIGSVPEEKRPPLKQDIFLAYDEWYPNWPIAVCCFNNKEAVKASPIMAYYEPMRPEFLFMPTLDCHTGDVPDLNSEVKVDHTLVVGVGEFSQGNGKVVRYQDQIPVHIKPYLPKRVMGEKMYTLMRNGDFVLRVDQVEKGEFKPMRLLPPGAERVT